MPEGVILWTRVTAEASEPVEVWWEMALDEEFLERTAQGTFTTDASRDYTVKVDVPGLDLGSQLLLSFCCCKGAGARPAAPGSPPRATRPTSFASGSAPAPTTASATSTPFATSRSAPTSTRSAPRRLLLRVRQRQLSRRHAGTAAASHARTAARDGDARGLPPPIQPVSARPGFAGVPPPASLRRRLGRSRNRQQLLDGRRPEPRPRDRRPMVGACRGCAPGVLRMDSDPRQPRAAALS